MNLVIKVQDVATAKKLTYLEMYLMCSGRGGVSTRSMFGERGGGGGEYHE